MQADDAIETQKINALTSGNPIQPKVYLIGNTSIIGNVILNEDKYIIQDPLEAFDVCFKIFWALNLKYPPESQTVWYTVQKLIYNISSSFDVTSSGVESLLNDIKNEL